MILQLTRNLRLNINNYIKRKASASGVIFPMAYIFIFLTVIFVVHMYRMNILEYNYDHINNSLTQALLGGCVVNREVYAKDGDIVIQDDIGGSLEDSHVIRSYELFKDCLKYNLKLDNDWNIASGHGITGNVAVEEYRIFNVTETEEGAKIIEYTIAGGNCYCIEHSVGEPVEIDTTDGTCVIEETSIYGKISFTLRLMGYTPLLGDAVTNEMMDGRYFLSRVVAIRINDKY